MATVYTPLGTKQQASQGRRLLLPSLQFRAILRLREEHSDVVIHNAIKRKK